MKEATKNEDMRRLDLTICCQAYYNSHLMVPKNLSIEEALDYAEEHLDEANIETPLEYVRDSDELDRENCDFYDED